MGKSSRSPYSNSTKGQTIRKTEFSSRVGFPKGPALFNPNNALEGPVVGSEQFPCACALVETMLTLNPKNIQIIFDKIVSNVKDPEIWNYIDTEIPIDSPLYQYCLTTFINRKITQFPIEYVNQRVPSWNYFVTHNSEAQKVKPLIFSFISEGLSPSNNKVYFLHNYSRPLIFSNKPRRNKNINPAKLPILCRAVLLLALVEAKEVNFHEFDRLVLGHDYELISSTQKPSTTTDRKRKSELINICHSVNAHIISYDTLRKAADKFYHSYVLEPCASDAAADYGVVLSTLSHETRMFRQITGLI
jgi:hypothetical protein